MSILCAGHFGDAADVLTTWADEGADLVWIDLDGVDAWCVLAEVGTALWKVLAHDREDLHACGGVLLDRFECDVEGETLDLEVELEAGDAVLRARDLEVHVAEVVFRAEDVGEDDVLADLAVGIALGDEADGDTCARCGDRHTCIHEGEAAAADRGHGSGAVGAHDFRDDADRVWELVFWRKDRKERALSECTVADFAATSESRNDLPHLWRMGGKL